MKDGINVRRKVSVIIPNYNYADFIIERIDSILLQIYPVSELIILDDASTDNSPEIIKNKLKEINQKYPKIKTQFIQNEKNSGGCVFAQWQKGVKVATGDYFWIAEADDSCDPHFLEVAMSKMSQDDDIKLFFSDSKRINQNGKVKSQTCTDWSDMWKSGHWDKDYIANGKEEIINYLSGQIYIMNVSSVVWKNEPRCLKIFKEAEKYKIAGDWYIYSRIMEQGKIAYSAKPLNYYRKHDKGSASSVINRLVEYDEVCAVQDRIKEKYNLDAEKIKWQNVRRRGMGFTANEKNNGTKGTIAWIVPWFSNGSGGHRTIFQNINRLIEHGYKCDMYVETLSKEHPTEILRRLEDGYGEFKGDIFSGFDMSRHYDMMIATGWNTAETVAKSDANHKLYFIQDFEPWFFPMGGQYIEAENSYRLGLDAVTIGRWLSHKISTEFPGTKTNYFHFCADIENYHPLENIKKEKAICLIFQPGKPRRCDSLALKALQIVQQIHPDVKIYLYGSSQRKIKNLKVDHLGTLSIQKCNELYNKCSVGICMSASNPSRIPFEMMAAGLPVVELYRENNLYDLPQDGCLLGDTVESIASAILEILDDSEKQRQMSEAGHEFMQDYPLESGFKEFIQVIDGYFNNKVVKSPNTSQLYTKPPVPTTDKVFEVSAKIKKTATYSKSLTASEIAKMTFSRRTVHKIKRATKRIAKRAIKFIRES